MSKLSKYIYSLDLSDPQRTKLIKLIADYTAELEMKCFEIGKQAKTEGKQCQK